MSDEIKDNESFDEEINNESADDAVNVPEARSDYKPVNRFDASACTISAACTRRGFSTTPHT